ncbi:hypothetical protein Y1Q_0008103 [Alligator mississippiensis]|uniref:DDE Tnp4 domain-containing protein n=1 Tax=Alligator mississippiensis TaxID=8496 RepID=A0A151NY85_ALLMI|nr:hypothetical protein Y1Q_0008103 [Alligator mississippiensis]
MTWATFQDLLEQLQTHLEQQDTTMQLPFSTNTCLALTLVKPAMPASLWYISHLFGVGKVTTRKAFLEVYSALQDVLDSLAVVVGFHALGFPQCIRALDWTHIPVT